MGPPDTLYSRGLFFVNLNFPDNYPNYPPKVKFITPIYHINVKPKRYNTEYEDDIGTPDLSILRLWRPGYKVRDILISIFSLFYMNKDCLRYSYEMSDELRDNKTLYEEKARYFSQKYANFRRDFDAEQNWDFTYSH